MKKVYRGEIYDAYLTKEVIGSEQAGMRPVVVISADKYNAKNTNVKVVVLTIQIKKENMNTHFVLPLIKGLPKRSMVLGEYTTTIDKSRLITRKCKLYGVLMTNVDRAVRAFMNDDKPKRKYHGGNRRGVKGNRNRNRRNNKKSRMQ